MTIVGFTDATTAMGTATSGSRDNFSPSVRAELAKRVNFHCSICDAPTLAPQTGTDRSFNIGKAAHIKAAAPRGPRYDPTQTSEQRRSISNGIWACSTCADIIDRDKTAYTVDDLHLLKEKAERLARERVGRPPGALTTVIHTQSAIQNAVRLFCLSEAERHELLDPRFSVSVNWSADGPVYEMLAREPVHVQMVIGGKNKGAYAKAIQDVLDYGGSHSVENITVRMEGSPIFPDTEVACRRLQISTEARPVSMTVALDTEYEPATLVEFCGVASHGNKGLRFEGTAFSGLLRATLTANRLTREVGFTLHFELQPWANKPVLRLHHFTKLKLAAQALKKGTRITFSLAGNGIEAEMGAGVVGDSGYFRGLRAFMYEVELLRKLDTFFGLGVAMPIDLDEVLRDATDCEELLALMEVERAEKQEVAATLTPFEPMDDLVTSIRRQAPVPIKVNQSVGLLLLGHSYGPFDVEVSCERAIIVPVGPANISPGQSVQLLFRAIDGHRWSSRCLPQMRAKV